MPLSQWRVSLSLSLSFSLSLSLSLLGLKRALFGVTDRRGEDAPAEPLGGLWTVTDVTVSVSESESLPVALAAPSVPRIVITLN